MSKEENLKKLTEEMEADAHLPLRETNLVFGEGDINAKVLFIGEAPGQKEDELKRPFVGRSGQLLTKMIESIGWKRADVYITNIVKRRPPDNRDPLPEEIESYKPYLTRQIDIINPEVIVTLGRFAMNYFLPTAKISRDQGKVFRLPDRQAGAGHWFVAPMFHPAAALRGTGVLKQFEESFKKLPTIIKKIEEVKVKGEKEEKSVAKTDQGHLF